MSKFNKKKNEQKQSEVIRSLYEKIKEADNHSYNGSTIAISGFYNETGLSGMSKDPMKLYDSADKLIERYERWAKNWKQLKKDCGQDILCKFSKEELQEALNNK